jgi:hypothetical protein
MSPSNNNKTFRDVNSKNVISPWAQISKQAKVQLADLKLRSARLRAAIKLFAEKERNGEPWPGDVAGTE